MTWPNFLIIGAPKAGTTGMYDTLIQHPQIYMSPVKEPEFFALEGDPLNFCGPGDEQFKRYYVTERAQYIKLFDAVLDQTAIGEASPAYLSLSEIASRRIQHYVPHARLIAILRQPADRAYSHYAMHVAEQREPLSFTQALAAEEERLRMNWKESWAYRRLGFYHHLLQPYYERFPSEQIRIYLYDDWKKKPLEVLQSIFRFLQVDDTFIPEVVISNVNMLPRSRVIQGLLAPTSRLKKWLKPLLPIRMSKSIGSGLRSFNKVSSPPIDPEIRRKLTEDYREDILRLQDLINRDLSSWLTT
jgi:hypothetical protein